MTTKTITVDFFQVVLPDDAQTDFSDILRDLEGRAPRARNFKFQGHVFRLQDVWVGNRTIEGTLVRIRLDELPLKADLEGGVESLELDDDEGIGEENGFLYDSRLNILVYQRNRHGVGAGKLCTYFEAKSGVKPISLEPVVQSSALQKLNSMRQFKKFTVKIANMKNLSAFRGQGKAIENLIDLHRELDAPIMGLEFSMGHEPGTLNKIPRYAKRLLRISSHENGPEVRKIEIRGSTNFDDIETLDLIDERMLEKPAVELNEFRQIPAEERRRALHDAWDKREPELRQMFNEP